MNSLPRPKVPLNRLAALSRYTATVKAQMISRMPLERRLAPLYAFVCIIENVATVMPHVVLQGA